MNKTQAIATPSRW